MENMLIRLFYKNPELRQEQVILLMTFKWNSFDILKKKFVHCELT